MTDHASTPPAAALPNWQRCWAISVIGLTTVFCCRFAMRKFGLPLHREIFATIAVSVLVLSIVLVVNWRLTRQQFSM